MRPYRDPADTLQQCATIDHIQLVYYEPTCQNYDEMTNTWTHLINNL